MNCIYCKEVQESKVDEVTKTVLRGSPVRRVQLRNSQLI